GSCGRGVPARGRGRGASPTRRATTGGVGSPSECSDASMAAMPPTSAAPGPLAGLRVIDCSTVLAGPYCTMVLGDLGEDVTKVEPPEGDATRRWGPPWVGSLEDGSRTAACSLSGHRNKRSMRLWLDAPH